GAARPRGPPGRHRLCRRPARLGRHQGDQVRALDPRDLRRLHGRALPPVPGAGAGAGPPAPGRPRAARRSVKVSVAADAGAADAAAAAGGAAETAGAVLRETPARQDRAMFVAATGVSQVRFLAHLVAAPGIAWERTAMFQLDEYVGLAADHPASLRRYLRER